MRLLYDNYVTPVIVDATLCANVFSTSNQEFCLLQTIDVVDQSLSTNILSQRIPAKKPGSELTHLGNIDFQMKFIAAPFLKKNNAAVYENQRKSAKYLRNKFNYNL